MTRPNAHKMSVLAYVAAVVVLLLGGGAPAPTLRLVHAMKDKATGVAFAPKKDGLEIFGTGVRKKGPIKVYAVAMYCTSALKEALSVIPRKDEKAALACLRTGAASTNSAFALQMTFKVRFIEGMR